MESATKLADGHLDYSPLTDPAWSRGHRRMTRATRLDPEDRRGLSAEVSEGVTGLIAWGLTLPLLLAIDLLIGLTLAGVAHGGFGTDDRRIWIVAVSIPVLIASAIGILIVIRRMPADFRAFLAPWRRRRLRAFADRNPGIDYRAHVVDPPFPATMFSTTISGVASDLILIDRGRKIVVGNYRFTGGRMQDRVGHGRAFAALPLATELPHMALVARRNRSRSALPTAFAHDQVLSLEGDFDRWFTLYAPRHYERDALYVFTPDLMARLIDELGEVDAEIVGDAMYICFRRPLDMTAPATYQRVLRIADAVGPKLERMARLYRDDRSPDHGRVSAPGRRLRLSARGVVIGGLMLVALCVFRILQVTGVLGG